MTSKQHLCLSLPWLGINFVWGALLGPVISAQVALLQPHQSAEALGLLYFLAAFPALVVPLVVGPISDRCRGFSKVLVGRRGPFIASGGALAALGLLGMSQCAYAHNYWAYVVAYFLVQLGANTAIAAFSALMPDIVPRSELGTASGYMAVMANVGTLTGLIAAVVCGSRWFTEIVLATGLALVLAFSLWGIAEKRLETPIERINWKAWLTGLWISPRKYPDFAWVWLTRALTMLGFYMVQPFLLYYVRDVVKTGTEPAQMVLVLALIFLGATISAFVGGRLSDRLGPRGIIRAGSFVVAVATLAFPFLSNLTAVLAVGLLFGIGYGAYISVDWALGAAVLPNENSRAKDMGVWHIAMVLPQQIGAVIGGSLILSHFHGKPVTIEGVTVITYTTAGYTVLFAVAAALFALGGGFIFKVKGVR